MKDLSNSSVLRFCVVSWKKLSKLVFKCFAAFVDLLRSSCDSLPSQLKMEIMKKPASSNLREIYHYFSCFVKPLHYLIKFAVEWILVQKNSICCEQVFHVFNRTNFSYNHNVFKKLTDSTVLPLYVDLKYMRVSTKSISAQALNSNWKPSRYIFIGTDCPLELTGG